MRIPSYLYVHICISFDYDTLMLKRSISSIIIRMAKFFNVTSAKIFFLLRNCVYASSLPKCWSFGY